MEYKGFIYAPTPKTAWDNLSMQEKSEMMKVAVRNGITDLKTIREKYNEFAEGGNLPENDLSETNQFGGGGYVPSRAIRQRIANWEGAAMDRDTIDPLSGKMAKKNRSFEEVATGFVNAIPKDIRGQVLGNQELADNLYSYAYNVGPGKFKERVVPALRRYYQGNGSVSEVTDSMWASGDKKLRGLRKRRTEERSGVSRALQKGNAANPVSYISQTDNNGFVPFQPMLPEVFETSQPVVPYSITDTPTESQEVAVSPYDIKVLEGQRRRDNLQHFMNVLNMVYGDDVKDESSFFLPLGALGYNNTFEDGGKIYIKPKNKGKFTALKERTGHSATWFKEHGTPAQKKMATFALNARHWKHGLGGNLFDDGGDMFVKYVDSYRVNPETGGVYDKTGEVKEGAVILPEVEVVGRSLGNYAIQREAERMRGIQSNQGLSGADPIGQFAIETAALNPVFKLAGTAGLYGLGRYGESLTGFTSPQNWARGRLIAREMDRSPFGSIGSPVLSPQVRTRVGDVEIDNPNLLYHLDRGNSVGAFSNQGAYVEDGFLFPGTPKDVSDTSYSWWNEGKPYATSVKGQPMTRLMTATKDTPGMTHVRSQNYHIGQWNGSKGFVLPSEYVNPEGVDVSGSTYTLDPNYGWRKVFENTPAVQWAEIERNSGNVTDNLLKWLGRPEGYTPKKPISQENSLYFDFEPVQGEMTGIWKDKGVNLDRIGTDDIKEALKKRWDELVSSRQDRHTIVRPTENGTYFLHDVIPDKNTPYGWRSIGTTQLSKDATGNLHMEDITNNTGSVRMGKPATEHGVQENALNSAIKVARQEGGDGVVTGKWWLSAPKQQHVVQKYHDREVIGNTGQHSNTNMVEERINADIRRGLPVTGEEETLAKSMLDLRRADDKETKILLNQPFWLLRTPTYDVPVKSTLFDPTIIDSFGKMHIDWKDPNILRGIAYPTLFGAGLYGIQK